MIWLFKPYCSRNMRMLESETYPSLMVKICLNASIFKHALIQKLCSIRWRRLFTSEDSVKWYECCYYVSLLDSNFRQTVSNDWHNKLYHYDGTFSQLFPIVLVYSLKWYFFSQKVIYLAIKFLSVYCPQPVVHLLYSRRCIWRATTFSVLMW